MDLISNVDLSCCGLSYDGSNLIENAKDAVLHARYKIYSVNQLAKMYNPDRIQNRVVKLEDRGWKKITPGDVRDAKIETIFEAEEMDFIQMY